MSRDTSQIDRNDRRLWLSERCPSCGAAAGARCQSRSLTRRKAPATLTLHAARAWRQRPCPTCKALPGEPCFTPRGRTAARPHSARLHPARGELHALEDVWQALERAGAEISRVRFSGGGGRRAGPMASASTLAIANSRAGGALTRASSPPRSRLRFGAVTAAPGPAANRRDAHLERRGPVVATRRQTRDRPLPGDPPGRQDAHTRAARHVARCRGDGQCLPPDGQRTGAGHSSHLLPLRAANRRGRPVQRRATAQSSAGRPPHAPGCASGPAAQPSSRPSGAPCATGRCRPDCAPKRATAQSSAGRPPHAPDSRSHTAEVPD